MSNDKWYDPTTHKTETVAVAGSSQTGYVIKVPVLDERPDHSGLIAEVYCLNIYDDEHNAVASLDLRRRPDDVLWITSVWVKGAHRKKGYGRALLKQAVWRFGDEDIYLEVAPYTDRPMDAAKLQAFYASFGFQPTSVPGVMKREARV